jgi:hypothetical protein
MGAGHCGGTLQTAAQKQAAARAASSYYVHDLRRGRGSGGRMPLTRGSGEATPAHVPGCPLRTGADSPVPTCSAATPPPSMRGCLRRATALEHGAHEDAVVTPRCQRARRAGLPHTARGLRYSRAVPAAGRSHAQLPHTTRWGCAPTRRQRVPGSVRAALQPGSCGCSRGGSAGESVCCMQIPGGICKRKIGCYCSSG